MAAREGKVMADLEKAYEEGSSLWPEPPKQETKQDIVQCKECKFWVGNGIKVEDIPYYAPCKTIPRNAEYFCADGAKIE